MVVGALDAGSLGVVPAGGRLVGATLATGGLAVAVAAILDLGVSETTGLEGDLRTGGLYRYSRDPQYVGDVLAVVGWTLLVDSGLAASVTLPQVAHYLLLPLAEEPWLAREYGDQYAEYRDRVPRFVGRRTVQRLRDDLTGNGTAG